MAKPDFGCGRPECGASTNISEDASFGTGDLDEFGFWEEGCGSCARAWEALYPSEKAWPYAQSTHCACGAMLNLKGQTECADCLDARGS